MGPGIDLVNGFHFNFNSVFYIGLQVTNGWAWSISGRTPDQTEYGIHPKATWQALTGIRVNSLFSKESIRLYD